MFQDRKAQTDRQTDRHDLLIVPPLHTRRAKNP